MALLPADSTDLLLGRITLAVFALVGTLVALAEWGLIPTQALLAATPAIAAALLLDTFLYNEFLVQTGGGIWLFIYVFVYAEAVVIATLFAWLRPHLQTPNVGG